MTVLGHILQFLSALHGKQRGSNKASSGLHRVPGSFTVSVMKRLGISQVEEDELVMF